MSHIAISSVSLAEDSPWVTRWKLKGTTGEIFDAYIKRSGDFSLTQTNHPYGVHPLVVSTPLSRTSFPRIDRRRSPENKLKDFAQYLAESHEIHLTLPFADPEKD